MDCYKGNARKMALDKAIIAIFYFVSVLMTKSRYCTEVVVKTSFYNLV